MNNILFIAPHADDEVLGCGGSMCKYTSLNMHVYVLVVTNAHIGAPELYSKKDILSVRKEDLAAHEILGVEKTIFNNFPAPALDQFPIYKIANCISKVIMEYNIDTVFLPFWGDMHNDHKVVFDAGMVACRPTAKCSVSNVLCYETLSETEWGGVFQDRAFVPNYFEVLTKSVFSKKMKSLSIFKSQIKEYPESRSLKAVESLARFRGASVTAEYAEAFMLLRDIKR